MQNGKCRVTKEFISKDTSNTLPLIPSPQGRGENISPLPWRERARVRGCCLTYDPISKNIRKERSGKSASCISGHGFTLIELIVVLFIVSLVMAVLLPSFAGFGENKLKSEAREMASILRYMNDSAITRKETYSLKFDLDKNIVFWEGPDGEKAKKFDDVTGVTSESKGMVSKGELIFFFDPLGVRENLDVHLSRDNKNMIVSINHLSGRVKIEDESEGPKD
jgi:prepilin-type N-terminal cleavage/methylation domain-containing protein